MNETNALKAFYWIKQAWNDEKCNTRAKCFKQCNFVDNAVKKLVEELFGVSVDEWSKIVANNQESNDNDHETYFKIVAKQVFKGSVH